MLLTAWRVFLWTVTIGGIAFAAGFFGPMILSPESNQGPLLGIFITGPLGLVAGFLVGVVRELLGYTATPIEVIGRFVSWDLWPVDPSLVARPVSALLGVVLAFYGVGGLGRGEGRGAAATSVLAVAVLYYAATGRSPAWFRR
jgi:hypothetical protein